MNKINNIYISFWFKELSDDPSNKVNELEEEVHSILDMPLMYNDKLGNSNISIPRIQGMSKDKKYFFTMSLVNAFLSINFPDSISIDEAILLTNNNMQLFYDILKTIYDVHIVYSSIKIELVDAKAKKEKIVKLFKLSDNNYEDLSVKRGIIKDDYYVNYILTYTKEYNFNFKNEGNIIEQDLFDRSMITSISEAKLNKDFLLTIVEVNDRYAFNRDKTHETSKDDIRGMIIEIKEILNNELYNKV